MQKIERLWRALETTPVLSGVRAAWKEIAGEGLPALEPFLRPSPDLATTYPCPEPGDDGCPRGVVIHAPDDIVAVCRRSPGSCESLTLTKDDIVVYSLDLAKLAAHLGALFGLKGDGPAPADGLARTLYLGAYRPVAGLTFPAYLTLQHDREDFAQVVERLAARDGRPFLLVAPTTDLVAPTAAELLRTRGAVALGLADFTAIDKNGNLIADRPVEDALKAFRDGVVRTAEAGTKDGMVFFPTPPEATWPDVEIRLRDGETVSVRVLGARGVFNYTQMGMASKKNGAPTLQWALLRAFADENGVLTWASKHAGRRNQKRRENLAKDLQRFFRIEGDPIEYGDSEKGWRVRFRLQNES
ncbi:MAG: hypothetical protein L0216_09530 [Planctomycetales bacterium]|nr:hypothetical protein [Planctomycetales bacterium]